MKKQRLRKVKIGGHWYKIKYRDNLTRDHDAAGMSSAANCDIILETGGKKSHRKEVFWHEVIEQLNYRYELNLPHDKISTIAAGMFQVLADNPQVIEGIV